MDTVFQCVEHDLSLLEFPDRLVLRPRDSRIVYVYDASGSVTAGSLRIEAGDRESLEALERAVAESPVPAEVVLRRVHGLVGVLRLSMGRFLIAVTGREHVGTVHGREVFRATQVSAFVVPREFCGQATVEEVDCYKEAVSNLNTFLAESSFLFSYTWPVSQSQQRLQQFCGAPPASVWQCTDERFHWNRFVGAPLADSPLTCSFVVCVTDGFCSSQVFTLRGTTMRLTLISRRSRHRQGAVRISSLSIAVVVSTLSAHVCFLLLALLVSRH